MRWLIVSTNPAPGPHHEGGWNIGDVFARLGTEKLIREVDPAAEFDLLNVDDHDNIMRRRPFDRCVLAGRPMFWPGCETHHLWTHILQSWPGADPRKVLAFGVGACYPPGDHSALLHTQLEAAARCCFSRVLLRDTTTDEAALWGMCPATFLLLDRPEQPTRALCNLMPAGGHYPENAPEHAAEWKAKVHDLAAGLLAGGADFVAHVPAERDFARSLGWTEDRIVYAEAIEPYLDAYASARFYVGSRMHGAVVCCSRRADVLAIGFDSRLRMVERSGGVAIQPFDPIPDEPPGGIDARIDRIRSVRTQMVDHLRAFAFQ